MNLISNPYFPVANVTSLVILSGVLLSSLVIALENPVQGDKSTERPFKRNGSGSSVEGKPRESNFKKLDLDKDGALSFEEFSKSERLAQLDEGKTRRLFDFIDRNKDGVLQGVELRPRDGQGKRVDFKKLDTNKDGALDLQELSKSKLIANQGDLAKLFKHLDKNKDGYLKPEEITKILSRFPKMDLDFGMYDTNESGGLDYEEYSKLPFVGRFPDDRRKKRFEKMDANDDGELSPEEIRSAHKRHHPRPPHEMPRGKRGKPSPEGGVE